jgi:hypothetical protein
MRRSTAERMVKPGGEGDGKFGVRSRVTFGSITGEGPPTPTNDAGISCAAGDGDGDTCRATTQCEHGAGVSPRESDGCGPRCRWQGGALVDSRPSRSQNPAHWILTSASARANQTVGFACIPLRSEYHGRDSAWFDCLNSRQSSPIGTDKTAARSRGCASTLKTGEILSGDYTLPLAPAVRSSVRHACSSLTLLAFCAGSPP